MPDTHEFSLVVKRKWLEEHAVHDREDRRRRTDPKRQRQYHHGGKARTLGEGPAANPHVPLPYVSVILQENGQEAMRNSQSTRPFGCDSMEAMLVKLLKYNGYFKNKNTSRTIRLLVDDVRRSCYFLSRICERIRSLEVCV